MCDMCVENNGEMTGCQDCGQSICFDEGTAYVTASGDVFCRRCGITMDEAEEEDSDYNDWDYYPADWYDANSPLSKLEPEDTPRYKYIGEGSESEVTDGT